MPLPVAQSIYFNPDGSPAAQHIAWARQEYHSLGCGENVVCAVAMAPGIDGPPGESVGHTS